jgi:hypothetical protein
MLPLVKRYRKDYTTETIVVERNYNNGVWHDTTENVPNAITNIQISDQAIVLGNGLSRLDLNLSVIKNHHGGLLGAKTLQSYGCNALYRDFAPDFLIATGNEIIKELAESDYINDHIVYTDAEHTLQYPNKFYLIPYNSYMDAGTTAAYIAAFDGHKRVYMLGFDHQSGHGFNNNVYAGTACYQPVNCNVSDDRWIKTRKMLFDVYDDVEFILVSHSGRMTVSDTWASCLNFRQASLRTFALEVDL